MTISPKPRLVLVLAALAAGGAALPLGAAPGQTFPPLTPGEMAGIAAATPPKARATPARPRRLLVFYRTESYVHASIPYGNEALRRMGEVTGAFEAVTGDDMAMFEPASLSRFDAVLFNNTTQLAFENPAHRAALLDFVNRGGGLAGLHAGSDNFPTWPEAQALLGGVFHSHPWLYTDTVAVKLDEPEHPLVAAFQREGFWVRDEIYQIAGPYSRERQRVVMSLDMSKPRNARPADQIVRTDGDFPIAWIKSVDGGGRVFYSSLGHNEDVYFVPEVMQHFLDGLQFALGDLKMDAVPSAKLTETPRPALAPSLVVALQDRDTPAAAQAALEALASYDYGADRAAPVVLESFVRDAGCEQAAALLEPRLLELVADPATPAGARDVAARLLTQLADADTVPALREMLRQPETSAAAARILFVVPGPEADAALLAALAEVNGGDRLAVIGALGRRQVVAAADDLARLAAADDPATASAALVAFGNLGTVEALQGLAKLETPASLANGRAWALLAAAERAAAGGAANRDIVAALRPLAAAGQPAAIRLAAARQLVQLEGLAAWDLVAGLLRDGDPQVRLGAAKLPAAFADEDAVTRAGDLLASLEPDVQTALLYSLEKKPGAASRAVLAGALASPDESVRVAAATALGAVGDETAVPLLLPLTPDAALGGVATDALARMPGEAVTARVFAALPASAGPTKAAIVTVLGRRQHIAAFAAVLAAASDSSPEIRRAACESVGLLAGPGDLPALLDLLPRTQAPAEVRALQRALGAAYSSTRDQDRAAALAAERLAGANGPQREILLSLLARLEAPRAVEILQAELTGPDADRRRMVLRALGNARNIVARPMLFAAARGAAEPAERVLAVRALMDLLLDTTAITGDAKIEDYTVLWEIAERPEDKEAVIAAVRTHRWNPNAMALLDRLGAPRPSDD